jgi:hypothetical protein
MSQQCPQQFCVSSPRLFYGCSHLTFRERISLREPILRRLILRERTDRN